MSVKKCQIDYKRWMETAILAGEIMLRNGAETYRVEDTINRILKKSNLSYSEVFVVTTGIFVTLDDKSIEASTIIKRVSERGTNLTKIDKVNTVSRKLCDEKLSIEEAFEELTRISTEKHQYSKIVSNISVAIVSGAFTLLLGGSLLDMGVAFLGGILLAFVLQLSQIAHLNSFLEDMIASFFLTAWAVLCHKLLLNNFNMDLVISGMIMPLVPGVAITNAIRDTLQGDYTSGGARALEAFVKAAAIAMGVGLGIYTFGTWLGGTIL